MTPDRVVLTVNVQSVRAPGVVGSFGVLYGHAPFLTELAIGEFSYRTADGRSHQVALSGGFFQVSNNQINVLADTAEPSEEIDVERAQSARERARATRSLGVTGEQLLALDAELERALNRLRIAGPDD